MTSFSILFRKRGSRPCSSLSHVTNYLIPPHCARRSGRSIGAPTASTKEDWESYHRTHSGPFKFTRNRKGGRFKDPDKGIPGAKKEEKKLCSLSGHNVWPFVAWYNQNHKSVTEAMSHPIYVSLIYRWWEH